MIVQIFLGNKCRGNVACWKIEFKPTAVKQLYKLPKHSQKEIQNYFNETILKLEDPKLAGKALSHRLKGFWRYRLDKYRIICKLQRNKLTILVIKIAKRDEIY